MGKKSTAPSLQPRGAPSAGSVQALGQEVVARGTRGRTTAGAASPQGGAVWLGDSRLHSPLPAGHTPRALHPALGLLSLHCTRPPPPVSGDLSVFSGSLRQSEQKQKPQKAAQIN